MEPVTRISGPVICPPQYLSSTTNAVADPEEGEAKSMVLVVTLYQPAPILPVIKYKKYLPLPNAAGEPPAKENRIMPVEFLAPVGTPAPLAEGGA